MVLGVRFILSSAVASLFPALLFSASAHGDTAWHKVNGTSIRALFADHELADGVHYAFQLRHDGTFSGVSMGKDARGTWRVEGNEFCWTQSRHGAGEECFEVERSGDSVRLLRDGVESLSAKLTPVAKSQTPSESPR